MHSLGPRDFPGLFEWHTESEGGEGLATKKLQSTAVHIKQDHMYTVDGQIRHLAM